ncbi:MAG: aminodeoxychorismate synthase component I [Acidobacteriota bacterium]|nr:aminodeoxychorismate synthase component I [Acidobacteriota bacterium]
MFLTTINFSADHLLDALLRLAPKHYVQILDSGGARDSDARFLVAGFDPFEVIEAYDDELHIRERPDNSSSESDWIDARPPRVVHGSALAMLDARLARFKVAPVPELSHLPAFGACVATFSYDLARRFARLRSHRPAPLPTFTFEPDAVFAFFDTLLIHDYARGETNVVSISGDDRIEEIIATLVGAVDGHGSVVSKMPVDDRLASSNFTRAEYLATVRRIREHIFAGDIYQANLTQQLTCALPSGVNPEDIFRRLRRDHPASFAAFLRRREDTVVSASPERFLRVEIVDDDATERRIEAWPIKGTRPRGRDATEDARLSDELLNSEKDRAENVMIVDLLRNDLGRVCRFGSIEVAELCALQQHPTLFHLVSKVRGRLRSEVTAGDIMRAAFPCGSITGAPKLRAMEIIDAVETVPRGLSMGAIGYFSFDGRIDLSVAIRTMTIRDGTARFNVGGGIVSDSDPAEEYEESLLKARALLRALDAST